MFWKSKSKIFLSILLAFIVGVFVGHWEWFGIMWQGIVALFFLAFIFLRTSKKVVVISSLALSCVLGAFYYNHYLSISRQKAKQFAGIYGQEVSLISVVSQEVGNYSQGQKLVIRSNDLAGQILLFTDFYPEYNYGDVLKFSGELQEPEMLEDFDYKAYLARQSIYGIVFRPSIEKQDSNKGSVVLKVVFKFKTIVKETVEKILPRPQSSLLAGLLLGSRETFPASLSEAMQITGTTHIVAISGYNITIIARILSLVLVGYFLKRQHAFILIVIGIMFFVVLTGAQAAVVRAGIMGVLVLLATQMGRLSRITNALVLSACVMVLFNPAILRFDVGFQLSFLATMGLIYLSPTIEDKLKFVPNRFGFKESLASTLGAQIFVLPILLHNFGKLSLISPLANMLILPTIPLAMLLGFVATLAGLIWLKLGWVLGFLVWLVLKYETVMIGLLGKLPLASVDIDFNFGLGIFYYLIVIACLLRNKLRNGLTKTATGSILKLNRITTRRHY